MIELWGLDPVHPSKLAYYIMAERLIEEMEVPEELHTRQPTAAQTRPLPIATADAR